MMDYFGKKFLYLSRKDVDSLGISIEDIIARLEKMFSQKVNGRMQMPPKPAIHTNGDAFLHAMPAYIPEFDSSGVKWVGGYPENYKRGLPYITGLLVLNDTETGVPLSVMDCVWITAIRTAAATALAAKYLALQESETLAILGCGVQGRANLEALSHIFHLSKVNVYDISQETARKCQVEMGRHLELDIEIAETPRKAVEGADILVTAGPFLMKPSPVIEYEWIKKGAFVCPLDLDSYLKPEVFVESDFLCTDDVGQFRHFKAEGLFGSCAGDITDLSAVISGNVQGRNSPADVITSINIGIALEDMAVAPLVFKKAKEAGRGVWLDL
jgi:ornithine cyclodeaminase/alanine dehydrogenase-like protein (mu-crystallin family)